MDRQTVQERFGIEGASAALHRVIDRARLVARTDVTVLIEGESGTGKELIANAIHGLSQRRHKTLQVINMGAIPEGLIEAELFGAEKGAYTSAVDRRIGYFEQATGGTIFLDEIGEIPAAAQVRLLRVLESGTFNRVGSSIMRSTDARVVAATNKDLGREVQEGRFREDLYYRLSTVIIHVPPLRERQGDVHLLLQRFLHEFARKYNSTRRRLDEEAKALLRRYDWPGNVRELRNVAEAATITGMEPLIGADLLKPLLRGVAQRGTAALVPLTRSNTGDDASIHEERALLYRALVGQQASLGELHEELRNVRQGLDAVVAFLRGAQGEIRVPPATRSVPLLPARTNAPGGHEVIEVEEAQASAPKKEQDRPAPETRIPTLLESERAHIQRSLEHFGGNRRNAAKALGISERSLYRRIRDAENRKKPTP